ncbi:MAG: tetratricopeptide (TPR) repeat protein [Cocleimonas sp.]|jgi:tetratricopeptide (TPR) repeat protein
MTNRQSNIIFYSVISIIIYALIINYTHPEFYENFSKSKDELLIKESMDKGEYNIALTIYQKIEQERIDSNNENNVETATVYEDMAQLYSLLGNKIEEKNYYLKSIDIKKNLKKVDVFGFAETYSKLGAIAEKETQYDQAQVFYEKSLLKRLGNTEKEEDEGMIDGMHQSRQRYMRLNNEGTIAVFKKLGAIHTIKKENDIAKKYYERALTASNLTFGEEDNKTLEIKKTMKRLGY